MIGKLEEITVVYTDCDEQIEKVYNKCRVYRNVGDYSKAPILCILGDDRDIVSFFDKGIVKSFIPNWKLDRDVTEYTFEEFIKARELVKLEEIKSISL